MSRKPEERIIDTFIVRDAEGDIVVQRWTNHDTRAGDEWLEGVPVLKTERGVPIYDLGGGRYELENTGRILMRPATDTQ